MLEFDVLPLTDGTIVVAHDSHRMHDPGVVTLDRFGISKRGPLAPLVRGALRSIGASLPRRIPGVLERAGATALTLHHSIASPEAIGRAHELGAPVYVWTVDNPALVKTLVR